jgi:dUTP pyrophosphatase
MKTLRMKLIYPDSIIPKHASHGSVGYDLFAYLDKSMDINPGETHIIGTGVSIALEQSFAAFIYARSGLGIKFNITPANCVGVIDSDYRGEKNWSKKFL